MNGFPHNLISYTKNAALGARELKNLSLSTLRKVFSLMGKWEKIALVSLLAVAALSLFASAQNFYHNRTSPVPDFGGIYSEGLLGQPTYINPLLARAEPDLSLTKLVFAGLYKYDQNGQLAPDLAEGMPSISPDQKQYTINLKRNAKWHNDKPVTADDVVFTIQLLQDPAYKSPFRPLWQSTTVEKLSDYSVKFTTKDISGPFLDNLTLGLLPKGVWNGVDPQSFLLSKSNLEAIGNGPYSIKEIKKLPSGKVQQISFQANPNYYQGSPYIDQVIFKLYDTDEDILNAFHSREIRGFGFVPLGSDLYIGKDQGQAQVLTVPLPQYQVVFFNLNNKILAGHKVRQALSLATDKRQIIERVFKNNALLPVSPLVFNNHSQVIDSNVDVAEAKKILDSDGWTIDPKTNIRAKQGQGLEITIATNDSVVNSKAAEALAAQWRSLGIQVNLNLLPSKDLMDTLIKPRNFDVLLFPQKFGADPDPFLFWHSSQVKDPGFNLTGFTDANIDKLITDARTTTDKSIREAKYTEFNKAIAASFPVIFLDQTEYIYTVDNELKNVGSKVLYDPSQRFNNISNWYMAEKRVWK
jgi:peptide/nickel transport system substrate-binding protein